MLWKILLILLISMVPLIELRGAIPVAVGMELGLPEWLVLIVAIIGNVIPVPIIYLFARKFLDWGANRKWKPLKNFCNFCLKKGEKAGEKLLSKAKSGVYFALFLFVAVPIPGTGAWTGTLAASILNLDFKKTTLAIIAGVLVAGLIMLAVSLGLFKVIFGSI
ncbi:small multi-drug export protein [Candidatus Saccharibacteria bacterium]|nr:small multi-drug export protein [Candidatus Saccharibacteria bacterium]MBQ3445740.1 small multi-drug export protein [Candidatus Saccharibacteria bacterium]